MYVQLNQSLLKQLRTYCANEGLLISRVVEAAIRTHLTSRADGGAGVLSEETRQKLRALQQALWGASADQLLDAAVEQFINVQVAENPRLRERYEAAARMLADETLPLELREGMSRLLTASSTEERT